MRVTKGLKIKCGVLIALLVLMAGWNAVYVYAEGEGEVPEESGDVYVEETWTEEEIREAAAFLYEVEKAARSGEMRGQQERFREDPDLFLFFALSEGTIYHSWLPGLIENPGSEKIQGFTVNWR